MVSVGEKADDRHPESAYRVLTPWLAVGDATLSDVVFTAWNKSPRNMMFSVQKSHTRNFIDCEQPGDMTQDEAPLVVSL